MRRFVVPLFVILLAANVLGQSPNQDKWIGTWKLNKAKSASGAPESGTTTIEAIPSGIKVVSQSTNRTGATTRTEYAAKYDGQEVPISGAAPDATAAVTRIDENTFQVVIKSQGTTTVARNVISADGKTRTVTQTLTIGNNENKLVLVYDKEP